MVRVPSAHLSQARRNRRQQSKWLKNHMTRCRANDDSRLQLPRASSSSKFGKGLAASSSSSKFGKGPAAAKGTSKEERATSSRGKTHSESCNLEGTVSHWACDLRFYDDQLLTEVREEQQCFQRKRDDALSKLKTSQRKWRQQHAEWEKKQMQPPREPEPGGRNMVRRISAMGGIEADISESLEEPEAMEINLPQGYDRNILGNSPSLCSESSVDSWQSYSSPSHPRSSVARSSTDDSHSEHLAVLAVDMQGKRQMSFTDELSSEEPLVRRMSLEVPKALLRRPSQRKASVAGAPAAGSCAQGGTNPFHSIDEKDDRDPGLDVLEGDIDPTGESHERERRRSIAQAAGGENTWNIMPPVNWNVEVETASPSPQNSERPDPVQFMRIAYQRMEEWRRDFPMDTLNQLANAFESWHLENGYRVTNLGVLEDVVHVSMGWSGRVVRNIARAHGLIPESADTGGHQKARRKSAALLLDVDVQQIASASDDQDELADQLRDHPLSFSKVTDLLEFIRNALELAEKEEPEVLWSEADYQVLAAVFKLASTSHNSLPVKHLIGAINALGFRELRLETALEQQRLVNITKLIFANRMARRQQQGKSSQDKDGPLKGTISFRDFVRVASMSLRDAERTSRMKEFSDERNAVKASGFGLLEVEDMRELHEAFCTLVQPNVSGQKRSSLDGMLRLLRGCNIGGFRAEEVDQLQSIVQVDKDAFADGSEISFAAFIGWMDAMAVHGLANITREGQTHITSEDLKDRTGFAASMIREQLPGGFAPRRRSSLGIIFSSQS